MIVSASRKTDIPAFYGDWLCRRLDEGFCFMRNTFSREPKRVSLSKEDVDAFVFWTKNPKPFLDSLRQIARRGFPFYMHVTVTGYGPPIERSVASWTSVADCCRQIADEFGPRAVAWRYDPIFLSPSTAAGWHIQNFVRLADRMTGISDEVAVSFVEPYRKVRTHLARLGANEGLQWQNPSLEEKRELVRRLSELAAERSIRLRICSQPEVAEGLLEACCIDPVRLRDVGAVLRASRRSPTRDGCNCAKSVDIGEYDTCPQGCVYCYANRSQEVAAQNLKRISLSQPGLSVDEQAEDSSQPSLPLVE